MPRERQSETTGPTRLGNLLRSWIRRRISNAEGELAQDAAQPRPRAGKNTPAHLPRVLGVARGELRGPAELVASRSCFLALTATELLLLRTPPGRPGASLADQLDHTFQLDQCQIVWAGGRSFLLRDASICVSVKIGRDDDHLPSQDFLVRYLEQVASPRLLTPGVVEVGATRTRDSRPR